MHGPRGAVESPWWLAGRPMLLAETTDDLHSTKGPMWARRAVDSRTAIIVIGGRALSSQGPLGQLVQSFLALFGRGDKHSGAGPEVAARVLCTLDGRRRLEYAPLDLPPAAEIATNNYLGRFAKTVTSQDGEDGVLAEIFARLKIERGWCVEFGAWDGKFHSNTWDLVHN